MEQKTIKTKKSSIFLLWLIPIVAFLIAAWTLFKHFDERGVDVVVVFESADGFTVGKSKLKYKGIDIGTVTNINISPESLNKVEITINLKGESQELVPREGTRFWKVEPTLSASGVSGLGTIVSGNYIACMPSGSSAKEISEQPEKYRFTALEFPPPDALEPGIIIKLLAKEGDISIGAPVFYKKFKIGQTIDYKLEDKGVLYSVSIDEDYKHLLKKNSKFWKLNAIDLKASMNEIDVRIGTLASMISGGISMNSPSDGESAVDGDRFDLLDRYADIELSQTVVTLRSPSGYGLSEGISNIYYNGVEAGIVQDISYSLQDGYTYINIRVYEEFEALVKNRTYYWIVKPLIGTQGVKNLETIIKGPYIAFVSEKESFESDKNEVPTLHDKPPIQKGISIALETTDFGAIKEGAGVYHKDMQVGLVSGVKIDNEMDRAVAKIIVYDKYKNLVNDSTMFYMGGGAVLKASIDEFYFQSGTIEQMLTGGIFFSTKDKDKKLTKKHFKLYKDYEDYKKALYLRGGGRTYTLLTDTLDSLQVGSQVLYKSIKVGEVTGYKLDKESEKIALKVYIEPEFAELINDSTLFYNVSGVNLDIGKDGLSIDVGSVATIVKGGIEFETKDRQSPKTKDRFTLLSKNDQNQEPTQKIILKTKSPEGIDVGTKIVYKGFDIGKITQKNLEKSGEVVFGAEVEKRYGYLVKSDTIFWISNFEMSPNGVKNVQNAIFGNYISLLPGFSDTSSKEFSLKKEKPSMLLYSEGKRISLKGSRRSSLSIGSPVYYRQIKIGEVLEFMLSKESNGVEFLVLIEPKYSYLVRENSVFYNSTALGFDVDLFGAKMRTETLETMISGGISMVIPDTPLKEADNMFNFTLYDEPRDEWLKWAPVIIKQ